MLPLSLLSRGSAAAEAEIERRRQLQLAANAGAAAAGAARPEPRKKDLPFSFLLRDSLLRHGLVVVLILLANSTHLHASP